MAKLDRIHEKAIRNAKKEGVKAAENFAEETAGKSIRARWARFRGYTKGNKLGAMKEVGGNVAKGTVNGVVDATKATHGATIGRASKWGKILTGVVVVGGALGIIGMVSRKRATPESVQDDALSPSQLGELTDTVTEEAPLPSMAGPEMSLMGDPMGAPEMAEDTTWRDRVGGREESPIEKLASAPVPDGSFEDVSAGVPVRS